MKLLRKKHKTESKDFQTFMNDYFTDHSMICLYEEEDTTVSRRLKGEALELAKQRVLNALPSDQDYLTRALVQIKDERATPAIEWTAENAKSKHSICYATKILCDWLGYDKYFNKLDEIFHSDHHWSKTTSGYWISGLKEEFELKYFWTALNDSDSLVRYHPFRPLENYYWIRKLRKDVSEIKQFTYKDVYNNQELFQKRQAEIKRKLKNGKKKLNTPKSIMPVALWNVLVASAN